MKYSLDQLSLVTKSTHAASCPEEIIDLYRKGRYFSNVPETEENISKTTYIYKFL